MTEPTPPPPPADDRPSHRLVVDRWEGDLCVVETEDGRVLDLPRWLVPPGAREGDVIRAWVEPDDAEPGARQVTLRVDAEATAEARAAVESLLERLRRRDPGGDIEL